MSHEMKKLAAHIGAESLAFTLREEDRPIMSPVRGGPLLHEIEFATPRFSVHTIEPMERSEVVARLRELADVATRLADEIGSMSAREADGCSDERLLDDGAAARSLTP